MKETAVPTTLHIGDRTFDSPLLLCPIAGYCDVSFRTAVRRLGGLAMGYTDLVNPRALMEGSRTAFRLAEIAPEEKPAGIQLYGCNPDELAAAAQWCEQQGPAVIDINMGCPVNKVAGKGGGAGLLRDCSGAVKIASAVVNAVKLPVTVKMRLGWDDGSIIAPRLAAALEDAGVAAVTVHGRTASQHFSGKVRREGIAAVVAAVKRMPVIGNGDVDSPEAAERMFAETGCAGVMIGRAALSDPWIFRRTLAHLRREPPPPEPTLADRIDVMHEHFRGLVARRGGHTAAVVFRQRFSWYARGLGATTELRDRMRRLGSAQEYENLIGEFAAQGTQALAAVVGVGGVSDARATNTPMDDCR
jgi:nifR3 family TIM-barrel protein